MNSLLMKKHRLHVFVAQQEGKPIPNAPGVKIRDSSTDRHAKSLSVDKSATQKQHEQDLAQGSLSKSPNLIAKKPGIYSGGSNTDVFNSVVQSQPVENTSQNMIKYRALYDFDAANDLEITVKVGDLLYLVLERHDGWSQCLTETGVEGLVPTAYIGRE
jgi:hypothetical protein